jgi:hypothetical protein
MGDLQRADEAQQQLNGSELWFSASFGGYNRGGCGHGGGDFGVLPKRDLLGRGFQGRVAEEGRAGGGSVAHLQQRYLHPPQHDQGGLSSTCQLILK